MGRYHGDPPGQAPLRPRRPVQRVCAVSYTHLATYLVCRGFLREVPAELIRPKAPKEGKRVLLERITFLWKRLGFLPKPLHQVQADLK